MRIARLCQSFHGTSPCQNKGAKGEFKSCFRIYLAAARQLGVLSAELTLSQNKRVWDPEVAPILLKSFSSVKLNWNSPNTTVHARTCLLSSSPFSAPLEQQGQCSTPTVSAQGSRDLPPLCSCKYPDPCVCPSQYGICSSGSPVLGTTTEIPRSQQKTMIYNNWCAALGGWGGGGRRISQRKLHLTMSLPYSS